jgi:hypothetical protein
MQTICDSDLGSVREPGWRDRAIGIDMTPAMIERARTNAKAGGYIITTSVVRPIDGLMPMITPNARLQARRRGVTPPRS